MVCVANGLLPLGVSVARDCVLVPRPVGWGGEAPGFWQCDRRREAAGGAAALVSRQQWNPPPNVAENNNTKYDNSKDIQQNEYLQKEHVLPYLLRLPQLLVDRARGKMEGCTYYCLVLLHTVSSV